MNQADVTKLISQLRIKYSPLRRRLRNIEGPQGRMKKIQKTLTALIKHERIELNYPRADETRGYVERLISDAIRYGDCHQATMEMADYWLLEKQLVHKLFKVLAPRFQNCSVSYTRMYRAPKPYPGYPNDRAVLELRGNPYPSLVPDTNSNRNLIHNILLDEAHREFRIQKYAEIAKKIEETAENTAKSSSLAGAESSTESMVEVHDERETKSLDQDEIKICEKSDTQLENMAPLPAEELAKPDKDVK